MDDLGTQILLRTKGDGIVPGFNQESPVKSHQCHNAPATNKALL